MTDEKTTDLFRAAPALARYSRTGHRHVEGWLSHTAIDLMVGLARIQAARDIKGPICEIGLHHGRLFILLHLLTRPDEQSVGWDLFEQQDQNVDRSGKGNKDRLMANLRHHGCDLSRIRVLTANSMSLTPDDVRGACGAPPRIFSVDGGHTAENTFHDLNLAARSIHENGLIILDDFFNEPWPGVAEGTCHYVASGSPSIYPALIAGNKFVFAKSLDAASAYQRELAMPKDRYARRNTSVFGHPVSVFTLPPKRGLWSQLTKAAKKSRVGRRLRRWASA